MTYRTFFTVINDDQLALFKEVFKDNIHQTYHDDELYYIESDSDTEIWSLMYEHNLIGYDYGTTIESGLFSVVIDFDGGYEIYGAHNELDKAQALFDQAELIMNYDHIVLVNDYYLVIDQASNI